MARGLFLLQTAGMTLAAALTLAAVPVGAAAAIPHARITYVTPTVSPGGTVTIKAAVTKGSRCAVSLTPANFGRTISLNRRLLLSGRGTWRYRLSEKAATGKWGAAVVCSNAAEARHAFRVALPVVAPAQIKVLKSGFVDQTYSFSSSAFLTCGVELQNVSSTDARNLTVKVTFADTQGSAIATSTNYLSLIPAGQVFYMSCLQQTSVSLTVASVQVSVKVGASTKPTGRLPIVSNVTLAPDGYGSQTLTGTLTNPLSTPLSQNATIYALYYDASGSFVGGGSTTTGAAVEPHASVAFSFPTVPAPAVTAEVSVDPCGPVDATLGACALP